MKNAYSVFKTYFPGLFLITCFCLQAISGISQVNTMDMQQFNISDGLPDENILTLLQDEQGFVWIGTQKGLVQYNGYDWKVFQEKEDNPFSLKGDFISALLETKNGDLWIGTDQGLSFFDRSLERFYSYEVDSIRIPYRSTYFPWLVHSLYEDQQGFVWLVAGERNQLYRWNPKTKNVSPIRNDPQNPNSIGFNQMGKPDMLWGGFAIAESEDGKIWLGSGDGGGLAQYDHQTEAFTPVQLTLPSDTVHCLYMDQENGLWLGTEKGLARYDLSDHTFHPYRRTGTEAPVYDIREDAKGRLWISRPFVLEKFDRTDGAFQIIKSFPDFQASYHAISAYKRNAPSFKWIGEKADGNIYFFFSNTPPHIYLYEPGADTLVNTVLAFPNKPNKWQQGREILSGMIDRAENLWLGTIYNLGLLKQNKLLYQFSSFSLSNHPSDKSILHGVRGGFTEDSNGNIWIAGLGKEGLSIYDPLSKQLNIFPSRQKEVYNIFTDDQGKVWSTGAGGVIKVLPSIQTFRPGNIALGKPVRVSSIEPGAVYYSKDFIADGDLRTRWNSSFTSSQWVTIDLEDSYALSRVVLHWFGSTIAQAYQVQISEDGKAWKTVFQRNDGGLLSSESIPVSGKARYVKLLCTKSVSRWGFGLYEMEVYATGPRAHHYYSLPGDTTVHKVFSHVGSAIQDLSQRIWLANGGGISLYHPGNDYFSHFPIQNLLTEQNMGFYNLALDGKGILWLITWDFGNGIFSFNPDTRTSKHYFHKKDDIYSLSDDRVQLIYADHSGDIWVGTQNGLNFYQAEENNFKRYLEGIAIVSLFQDNKGRYWVGTWGNGLILLNKETGIVKSYTIKNGLPSDVIMTIKEDGKGNLWLGTNNGLSKLDVSLEVFHNFRKSDGLIDPPNYWRSFKDSRGNLYFGGANGFTVFNPDVIHIDSSTSPIAITGFYLSNEPVKPGEKDSPLKQTISETSFVELAHDQNIITFEFAILSYQQPEKNRYQVMLEGLDDDWVDIGQQRFMPYSGLSPGDYTFRVRGANVYEIWNEKGTSVKIRVLQPWWWSTIAKIAYAFLVLSLFYAFYRWRTREQAKKLADANQLNARLQQVDKLKDQFLANTSHELRTPLQGIIGLSESLEERVDKPDQKEDLSMIISSGKRLNNLVSDILDFSKLKNFEIELLRRPINLRVLLDIVLRNNAPLVKGKEVVLINEILPDLPAADGDENRLQQVLYNLIGNAIKFTEKGYIKVNAVEKDGMIQLSVEDTGTGIPKNKQEAIFQEFEQADGSISREFTGTGLGLSISKKLVELHGGNMWVESEVGQGSQFYFTLPVSTGSATEIQSAVTTSQPVIKTNEMQIPLPLKKEDRGEVHILIVDDEPINQQVFKNHLANQKFHLTQAMNGEEAIKLIEEGGDFDLVLLDVMMPRMSGYEVCREIRKKYLSSELPVIMITAKNQLQDIVQGLSLGANDYLPKPFHKEELIARIKTQIDLHHIFDVAGRFVPNEFLHSLNHERLTEVVLGDHMEREVTVMFADIRDYTTLAESMTPEENFRFVNAFHGRMGPIVKRCGGFVNQYLGDAIMAIFPSNPESALQAAIAMQQELQTYNQQREAVGRRALKIGIGLHSGPLIMGIIGDQERMAATTISDTVNTASRIENLTKHYGASILLSEDCKKRMETTDSYGLRYLGKVQVKGKKESIGMYECYDGDAPAISQQKSSTIEEFKDGLQQFFDREFPQAGATFDKILKINPYDQPARLFMNKSSEYTLNGVPEHWTGVEVMTSK